MKPRDFLIFFVSVCTWAALDGFTSGFLGQARPPLWANYILALLVAAIFAIREARRG